MRSLENIEKQLPPHCRLQAFSHPSFPDSLPSGKALDKSTINGTLFE